MNTQEIRNKILEVSSTGKIFSCTFRKRSDGTLRKLVGRIQTPHKLRGGKLGYDSKEKDLFIVFDVQKGAFRSIPLENVIEIRGMKKVFRLQ